ncbi:MAG: chlorite dismutase family protein, partial [Elusimicrobiota bacterium]
PTAPAETPALDLREKGGVKDGVAQYSDRRLFMQMTAFSGCRDTHKLLGVLGGTGVDCVLYEELNDPTGVAVLAMAEDPGLLLSKLRRELNSGPFAELSVKPEFSMLGRTYSLGYEPALEDWLLHRPRRVVSDPAQPWAIWYPLRRTGAFSRLPRPEQMQILKEHGTIGRQFGDAGAASDIRLACHGLDKNDNDFVIGLVGKELHPLSALVETMRPTVQTSQYLQNLGPFFVGRAVWRTPSKEAAQ